MKLQKYCDDWFGFKSTDTLKEKQDKFEKRMLIEGMNQKLKKDRIYSIFGNILFLSGIFLVILIYILIKIVF